MKRLTHWAAATVLATLAIPAFAVSKLTPAQCNDYPFVKTATPATHKQLVNELGELESVGYDPSAGDQNNYPNDLETAEAKLQTKYRKDCLPLVGQPTAMAPQAATSVAQQ